MRILISWTGSKREPYLVRAGAPLIGAHLQLVREPGFKGAFDLHYLLAVPDTLQDAEQIVEALAAEDGAPRTETRVVQLLDPTDHNEIVGALGEFFEHLGAEHESDELAILLNTGTPQMQTVWMLLTSLGLLRARVIQTSPADLARQSGTPPVRETKVDLDVWRKQLRGRRAGKPRK